MHSKGAALIRAHIPFSLVLQKVSVRKALKENWIPWENHLYRGGISPLASYTSFTHTLHWW